MMPQDDYQSLCRDCGIDTTSVTKTGRRRRWEWYRVHDSIWRKARMTDGFLCIGCLERRLGRKLNPRDFTADSINIQSLFDFATTARLRDRLIRQTDLNDQSASVLRTGPSKAKSNRDDQ